MKFLELFILYFVCHLSPAQSKHFEKETSAAKEFTHNQNKDSGSFDGGKSSHSQRFGASKSTDHSGTYKDSVHFGSSKDFSGFGASKDVDGSKTAQDSIQDAGSVKDFGIFSDLKQLKEELVSDLSDLKENFKERKKGLLSGSFKEKFKSKKPESAQVENTPFCPVKVKPIYEEAIVERPVHSVVTVNEEYYSTQWETVTENVPYTVTVTETSTTTMPITVMDITKTEVVPEVKTATEVRMLTVDKTFSDTSLQISTFTATNTITTVELEADWITVTDYSTQWNTHTNTVFSTTTEWVKQVETVTQPAYVTTSIWVEAPQLKVITTTDTQTHYMPTTSYFTKVLYSTVCED